MFGLAEKLENCVWCTDIENLLTGIIGKTPDVGARFEMIECGTKKFAAQSWGIAGQKKFEIVVLLFELSAPTQNANGLRNWSKMDIVA